MHSCSAEIRFHIPIRDRLEFILSAGLGQAELMTGFASVDGTDSVDRKYKNISVGVKNMGVVLIITCHLLLFSQQV